MRLNKIILTTIADIFSDAEAASWCVETMAELRISGGSLPVSAVNPNQPGVLAKLESCGLLKREHQRLQLTSEGAVVADSFRECLWLLQRNRKLHYMDQVNVMNPERFAGEVLEIGSGFGCNLVSLANYAHRRVALEVMESYLQLSPFLMEYCGVETPERIVGSGHALPFSSQSFDHVLMIGSIQYMPLERVFDEAFRVLRPGGQCLVTVGYVWATVKSALSNAVAGELKSSLSLLRVAVESLQYEYTQRRFAEYVTGKSMPRTIFPRVAYLKRLAERAGFSIDDSMTTLFNDELYLLLKKPAESLSVQYA